ncbi:unnamed protein product (macronuclear) [Paramecium tetraurelia]|uniref:Probable ubiquitin carboxyl-terminal hydrolase MINDY-4 n=1 Tax=Paramecium tetraurelia TaxID=5888 RepID=A0DSH5_PARTE|nr:uncharacterized protein GSPATT00019696001 [Paramecium tetraurelia]CAK85992.1 unnamed protein product [Paramecium tetraurelia]|eukprot:XP_001453389.1 hypothetical protein (macronuclear) [Paramecium tetraurelia strain d4-2]
MHQIVVKALIREFLIKSGLTETLNTFDQEYKDKTTITRMDVILQLGLSIIVKRNNESLKPLKSLIEILVSHLLTKKAYLEAQTIASKAERIEDIPQDVPYDPSVGASRMNKMKKRPQSEYKPKNLDLSKEEEVVIEQKEDKKDETFSSNKGAFEAPRKPSTKQVRLFDGQDDKVDDQSKQENKEIPSLLISQPPRLINMKKQSEKKEADQVMLRDLQDNNQEDPSLNIKVEYQKCNIKQHNVQLPFSNLNYEKTIGFNQGKRKPQQKSITQPIKKLLFQGTMTGLPKSWSQPFIFKDEPTFFGLHQLEGGPCGVLASVQAYYLKHFLFSQSSYSKSSIKQNCLLAALSDIFYKANKERLIIAIPARDSSMSQAIGTESCDQLEYQIKSLSYLYEVLLEHASLFFGQNGVTLFFYSLILTKGVEQIMQEMDSAVNPLIGNHGHCTQEAVNLMLTGQAISNCFDGCKQIDDMKIKGIEERSEIGFLTIFEHFQYLEVGKNLKEPLLPIWVICKEYHYSVIFGCNNDVIQDKPYLKNNLKEFDLVFYDGLNNPDDLIIITIRRLGAQLGKQKKKIQIEGVQFDSSDKVTPLIECLLKTKYGELELDWNDSMPIL